MVSASARLTTEAHPSRGKLLPFESQSAQRPVHASRGRSTVHALRGRHASSSHESHTAQRPVHAFRGQSTVHAYQGQSTSPRGKLSREPDRTAASACLPRPKHSACLPRPKHIPTREALTRARPHSGQLTRPEHSACLEADAHPSRGKLLREPDRTAASAYLTRPKHSLLTSFTTTLAGSRAGARCDAAQGCCYGRGRRRTRRGPKVSTVCLFPLLLLSLAPELARAATRREAAAAEGGGARAAAPK